jgi:peroxin-14
MGSYGSSGSATPAAATVTNANANANGEPATSASAEQTNGETNGAAASTTAQAEKPAASSYGRLAGGRAAIPAWQMAAQKKNEESNKEKDTSESGTAVEASGSS